MTTTIYLIRHGEVHNPKQILYGRLPRFKLSKRGEAEIEHTANFLKTKNIKAIYSSPLLRARQTAGIIQSKLNLPKVYFTKGLLEVKTSAQGKPGQELDLINHDYYSHPVWQKNDDTMEKIALRMENIIKRLLRINAGTSMVAVSHGDPIMILKAALNNVPLKISSIRKDNFDISHGEVVKIQQTDNLPITINKVFIPNV